MHAVAQEFPNGLKLWRERMQAQRALVALLRAHDFDLVHVNGSADHRLVMPPCAAWSGGRGSC